MLFTPQFIILLAAGAVMIGFSGWSEALALAGAGLISLAIVLAIADWAHLRHVQLEIGRLCDEKLSLGSPNPVRLALRNPTYAPVRGTIRDEYPEGFAASGNVAPLDLPPRSEREITYHVTPPKRGDYEFGDIYARFLGPFGMLIRQVRYPSRSAVKVYPNLLDIRRYEISLRREHAVQPGQKLVKIPGRGTEFESLRDYARDDEFRSVDWKASARRGKLVSRQYQEEKSQNVMIVLDCGRIMGPMIEDLSRLDHSVNAAMMLAYAASRKGDKVGLMAFGEDIGTYSAPRGGKAQTLNLLRLAYNLQNAAGDSAYQRAIPYLSRRWTRRSLVVFFTDFIDPESSRPLISQIGSLAKKHLVMCVAMSDPAITQAASRSPEAADDVYTAAAAIQTLRARGQAALQLAKSGIVVLDLPPEKFTVGVVNEYLSVKARGRL